VTRPDYSELVAAWKGLRASQGLSLREVACVGAERTLLIAETAAPPGAPVVALSAGVHGDEPAGPWALLSIVRDGLLDARFGYRIWCCTNPSGYERYTRENADGRDINRSFNAGGTTPEARAIVTANRDRRFALVLDLHEDFEADGFYCYEPVVEGTAPIGASIVRALDDEGLPVQDLEDTFELGYPPDAAHLRTLERGHVMPDPAAERAFFPGTPYSLHMLRRSARRALTLETPRMLGWAARLAMHRIAVVVALERLRTLAGLVPSG
jgi:protein MpaA